MLTDIFAMGFLPNTTDVVFYDTGMEVNEYGVRVASSSIVLTEKCLVIDMSRQPKRMQNGVVYSDFIEIHKNQDDIVTPFKTRAIIGNDTYEILVKSENQELTGTAFFRAAKRVM